MVRNMHEFVNIIHYNYYNYSMCRSPVNPVTLFEQGSYAYFFVIASFQIEIYMKGIF